MNMQDTAKMQAMAQAAPAFPLSPAILPGLMRVVDSLGLWLAGVAAFRMVAPTPERAVQDHVVAVVFFTLMFLFLANRSGFYQTSVLVRPFSRSDDILVGITTSVLLFSSLAIGLQVTQSYTAMWGVAFILLGFAAVMTGRIATSYALKYLSRRGVIGRRLVVLGGGDAAHRCLGCLRQAQPYFTRVDGLYTYGEGCFVDRETGMAELGDDAAFFAAARAGKIDDVMIALPWSAQGDLNQLVERLKQLPINVYLATDLVGFDLAFQPVLSTFRQLPMLEVVRRPISGWSSALKVIEDYAIASVLLVALAPLLALIAVAIRLDSRGPVFFKQKRQGFNNQVFEVYKFRSMYHQKTPEAVVRQARKGDPRVTRVGRVIRATSLDELPQLLNVLNGTMSLVGPRPHALNHNEEYGRAIRNYFARHRVRPGITGWAQVNGLRGETETLDKMEARVAHDVYYADNWSLLFDLRILIMTALVVPFQKSAY